MTYECWNIKRVMQLDILYRGSQVQYATAICYSSSYVNNIALAKPEGRDAHARFSAAIFSLALYHCAAEVFRFFFAIWSSYVVYQFAHAYIFVQGDSLLEAFRQHSESEKDFVTSWRVSIPLSFHPLFTLWPTSCFSPRNFE